MLVSMDVILKNAMKHKYGVPAPNIYNLETTAGAFEAAAEVRSPLILDCGESNDLESIPEIVKVFIRRFPQIPVALNLDHGKKYMSIIRAIRSGFTSVMADCSQSSFEKNISDTKEIVKIAHSVGVSVEAELGHVGNGINYLNDKSAAFTQTEEAAKFVKETGVDCLAVAIGTAHGKYAGTPHIDFPRLKEIRKNVSVPLVLHGGSSTGDDNLVMAVNMGITKVNLGFDLYTAGINEMKQYFAEEEFPVGSIAGGKNKKGFKKVLIQYMVLLGSNNKF